MAALPTLEDVNGKTLYFVDGDTLSDDPRYLGKRYRIKGFDAFETDHTYLDEDGNINYKQGTRSLGDLDTEYVAKLLKAGGFKAQYHGEEDKHGRGLISFVNDKGEDGVRELYRHGIARIDKHSSRDNIDIQKSAELVAAATGRTDLPYHKIAEEYKEQINNPKDPLIFKGIAPSEKEFDPNLHTGVAWRDYDKTIDNKPTGFWDSAGDSFFVGVKGLQEGFFGYLDAIGEITESEMIQQIGIEGVQNARNEIAHVNDLILDYDQVDGVLDGFTYVMNNAAMSAPYLLSGFASLAVAVPAKAFLGIAAGTALASLPLSMIYAGHTWNEMEGERGIEQFIVANVSGVIQATLERFGAKGLVQPVEFFSEAGKRKAIRAVKSHTLKTEGIKLTTEEAEKRLARTLKGEIGRHTSFLAKDFAKYSFGSFGKAVGKGMVREGVTEALQETTQMGAVSLASDKHYTNDEIAHRLMNAGIAGMTLGGTFSGAANTYTQGKNKVYQAMYKRQLAKRRNAYQRQRTKDIPAKDPKIIDEYGNIKTIESNIAEQDNVIDSRIMYDEKGNPINVFKNQEGKWVNMDNDSQSFVENVDIWKENPEKKSNYSIENLLSVGLGISKSPNLPNLKANLKKLEKKLSDLKQSQFQGKWEKKDNQKYINTISKIIKEIAELKKKIAEGELKGSKTLKEMTLSELEKQEEKLQKQIAKEDTKARRYIRSKIRAMIAEKRGNPIKARKLNVFDKKGDLINERAKEYEKEHVGVKNWFSNIEGVSDFVSKSFTGFYEKFIAANSETRIKPSRAVGSRAALDAKSRTGGIDNSYFTGKNFKEFMTSLIAKYRGNVYYFEILKNLVPNRMTFLFYDKAVREASVKLINFGKRKNSITPSRFEIVRALMVNKLSKGLFIQTLKKHSNSTNRIKQTQAAIAKNNKDIRLNQGNTNELRKLQNAKNTNLTDLKEERILNQALANQIIAWSNLDPTLEMYLPELITLAKIIKNDKYAKLSKGTKGLKDTIDHIYVNKRSIKLSDVHLYQAAVQLKHSYDLVYRDFNKEYRKTNFKNLPYNKDLWWTNQSYDYRKVKNNPDGFKDWAVQELKFTEEEAEQLYDRTVREGDTLGFGKSSSPLEKGGRTGLPLLFRTSQLSTVKGFDQWKSENLFEGLNKAQIEIARWITAQKYFGQGGWKLSHLIHQMIQEGHLTDDEINKFAYYTKGIVDSAYGAYRRIESPTYAAINAYLSSWAIFAGLPLAAASSFPETLMIYFNLKDDKEFQDANKTIVRELSSMWNSALKGEVDKTKTLLKQLGLSPDQSTAIDRLASGERDVGFHQFHEAFFVLTGIQGVTQFQRRVAGGNAIDFIKSNLQIIEFAPRNKDGELQYNKFVEIQRLAYDQLVDLGIEVELMDRLIRNINSMSMDLDILFDITDNKVMEGEEEGRIGLKMSSPREQLFKALAQNNYQDSIVQRQRQADDLGSGVKVGQVQGPLPNYNEHELIVLAQQEQRKIESMIETAMYRYINERVQLPQSYNRPLFFQDPHYQLLTQFNGFMSTFTANIVPKLWKRNLINGNIQVKYDTFALIILMMGMAAASQYLKDLLKYGETSPYLDEMGYLQRALYSSGAMGQYERLVDLVVPLYPQRDSGFQWLSNAILGEAGPTARILGNMATGLGQLTQGETERAVNNLAKGLPVIAPMTKMRHGLTDIAHGKNPFRYKPDVIEDDVDLRDYLFRN